MLLTLVRIKELQSALDEARRTSTGPGRGAYCTEPNIDSDGNTYRWEPKPRSRNRVGAVYPDGTTLEVNKTGDLGVKISLGVHGRAHLGIDPKTGKVYCTACCIPGEE